MDVSQELEQFDDIQQFCDITGCSVEKANIFLLQNNGDFGSCCCFLFVIFFLLTNHFPQ